MMMLSELSLLQQIRNAISRAVSATTWAIKFLDYAHHEIHGGSSFKVHYTNTTTSDDDHRSAVAFTTPNTTKWGHLVATISASQPAEFFIIEAPGVTNPQAGTEVDILNRNRNSANASVMVSLEATPTAAKASVYLEAEMVTANFTGGTELDHTVLAGGEGPRSVGGVNRGAQEFVLKQNTTYLFYLQNIGANANIHSIELDWYEHTDK